MIESASTNGSAKALSSDSTNMCVATKTKKIAFMNPDIVSNRCNLY